MFKQKQVLVFITILLAAVLASFICIPHDDDFISYTADLQKTTLKLYWKDEKGQRLKNLPGLNNWIAAKGEKLLFAMNGGMYQQDRCPLGLYIQEGKLLSSINKRKGSGNFYLQPNGIFYISSSKTAFICKINDFIDKGNIQYATQSGPLLLMGGAIHPAFKQGSSNLNIRNGVGILPGNKVLFAMSKKEVNLYDFASFFKRAGCSNALYLDGFVSRTWLPEKNWIQTDGDFGVMIGCSAKQ